MIDKVKIHKLGYYEVINKPTTKELNEYYSNKYYQDTKGSYQIEYSDEELLFINNQIEHKYNIICELRNRCRSNNPAKLKFLDVGCGEGWALRFFKNMQWDILGLDYSNFGCSKFNPDCIDSIVIGDIYDSINDLKNKNVKFDVVWLTNVLEHVLEPIELLNDLKCLISKNGIAIIEVPNDFSILQLYLLSNGLVDIPYWIAIPDHISYFNKESLKNIANYCGYEIKKLTTSYPIDLNLFNSDTNYINDKTKGKNVHKARVKIENFIHNQSLESANLIYEAFANAGMGRDLISFMVLKQK